MKRYIILSLLMISTVNILYSQTIGEWTAHLAYHNASLSIPADNIIYVLSENLTSTHSSGTKLTIGSLFSYDIDDNSITTYDKSNYLNDNDIVKIAYSKEYKTLILVYKNSNIDLLINDKEVYNISEFKNKSMLEDKTLNNIFIENEYAYLSTNFGIVVVNLKKKEISNTYNLGNIVYNTAVLNNYVYAATNEGILKGDISKNLLDKNNWEKFTENVYNDITIFDNILLGNIYNNGVYKCDGNSNNFEIIASGNYSFITTNNKLILGNSNNIIIFDSWDSKININQEENFINLSYSKNDIYWGSNGKDGLNGYKYDKDNNKLIKTVESIIPSSPRRNLFHYMTIINDKLFVAGGSLNYGELTYPGTIMEYSNGEWSYFQEEGISDITKMPYINITAIIEDPVAEDTYYASSARHGLYKFNKKKEFVELYNMESGLETILPNDPTPKEYVSTNGLQYDKNNNLWMINNQVAKIIKVLKRDGTWLAFDHPTIAKLPTCERIMFDKRGWLWLTSMRNKGGVFCFDTNNTLENTQDDRTRFFETFTNQDDEVVSFSHIFSIAEDKNGVIWIGTDQGPLIINNPTKVFDDNFYCTQIKVPRNDGTNSADLLLVNEEIKAIQIDGANRKWIGTTNSGVYLISEDGLETIHHFTTDNSPLISNNIQSIAINPKNGIVYIGTDAGLISYKSDATEAETSFNEDAAYAYPNPVYPDYEGVIAVKGLVRDSDVKIVDASGYLVYSGTSLGGQFTWNGKDRSGKRVASGVYFVLTADSEGKEGIATKILIIK